MSIRRIRIVWGLIGTLVATGLCPPWSYTSRDQPAGYFLIFLQPHQPVHVDLTRLVVEWVVLSVVAIGLYFAWPFGSREGSSLPPMNYRRGLLRVFGVLASAWVVLVLLGALSGRWEPWRSFEQSEERVPLISPEEFLKESAAPHADIFDQVSAAERKAAHRRWMWASGTSIAPPLFLYSMLFYVLPWIYRGFKHNG